jgi:lysophospholipase L1-like esterase
MGYRLASVTLAPVFALQGRRVRRGATLLPEAPGPRSGVRGDGPALRLLIVGDSAAAGVGAASQDEALSGRLVAELAPTFRVAWTLIARTGATSAGTARHLARHSTPEGGAVDVAVISLGANDVTARRPIARWLEDLNEVAALLRTRYAVRRLVFSGLPPMHLFTAFPQPLRWYLGATARRHDRALARWTAGRPDCEHVPLELERGAGLLAPDGLHPGPVLYERWAAELARCIRGRVEQSRPDAAT